MNVTENLIKNYFGQSNSHLYVDDIPVNSIVAQYATPLFIYAEHILAQKLELLRKTLPPKFSISYSIKANPNQTFLQYFLRQNCGLEVASGGELYQALSTNCPPEKIIFAGPGKTSEELTYALESGIGEIHAESLGEIDRIDALSQHLGGKARVALRVNPSEAVQGGAMRMGGKAAPFGIDEEVIDDAVDQLVAKENIEFRGLHLFTGTQILDHTVLLEQYRRGLALASRIATRLQQPLPTLDFGGGYGIPYFAHEQALDMIGLGQGLAALITECNHDSALYNTQFIVEPGRFLVGEAGIYVVRVIDIKISRGKKFLIVDGGMHHHLAASGNLGQTIKRNFPIAILNKLDYPASEAVDVVGPLCTPLDILARNVELPQADIGDLIGVFLSGAYARTASPLGFLSHQAPAEVWVEKGQMRLIRRRGEYKDYLQDQCE